MILAQEFVSDKPARIISNRIYKWLTTTRVRSSSLRRGQEDKNFPVKPAYLPPAEHISGREKGEAKEIAGTGHFSQCITETYHLKVLKCTTVICSTSLHCHFNIVQTQCVRIQETHLLVLVALAVVYSRAVQTLKPDLNSLKHYYTAKYRFQLLVLLTAAFSNLPSTLFGTPCMCFHGQHIPCFMEIRLQGDKIWLFGCRWRLSIQCKLMDLHRRKMKYYSSCTLPSLLNQYTFCTHNIDTAYFQKMSSLVYQVIPIPSPTHELLHANNINCDQSIFLPQTTLQNPKQLVFIFN